eukprot:TRINITY_DN104791_c0_g1_i1.p1 TRINITY_DN104791_c0_g1~~TRINITY_DN104791_c0_g1_i1.p1  ORF type:complete len:265 (+),score=46.05 TRINITY_DN104791_c0_g1_i1:57-797(+)
MASGISFVSLAGSISTAQLPVSSGPARASEEARYRVAGSGYDCQDGTTQQSLVGSVGAALAAVCGLCFASAGRRRLRCHAKDGRRPGLGSQNVPASGLPSVFVTSRRHTAEESSVACRVFDEEEEEEDDFFERKKPRERKVEPAWNKYTSPSKVEVSHDCVFFFPNPGKNDPMTEGWINPKMYKKKHLSLKMLHRQRRNKKRAWRKLSKRLKDEWRLRRYPRDESGNIAAGTFGPRNRYNPAFLKL